MSDTLTPPPDETAVDLRKATLQEIAAFSVRVLEQANPRTMIRKVWIAIRRSKAGHYGTDPDARGERSDRAVELAGTLAATPEICTGCAVGTILLHDGPQALKDWLSVGTEKWNAGASARLFFSYLSNAFEGAHNREEGLKRCLAIARLTAATGKIMRWRDVPSEYWGAAGSE